MTAKEHKNLEHLVEQKILEFFGDPDSGLKFKRSFVSAMRKRMNKKQTLVPNSVVVKKYGVR
ncbi:TPA: hypothetical protein DIS55_04110 [Candidatus Kaiserbacteria bacterium]|nr:hypothetical protein [Candidatus Kaiserbacteria bacterium]